MTTKIKATKSEVQAVAAEVIALAREAGETASDISSICDAVSAITRDLHFRGIKVGRFSFTNPDKACPVAAAFVNGRFPFPDMVSDATVSTILSFFRKAVETGEDYTENPSRKTKAERDAAKAEKKTKALQEKLSADHDVGADDDEAGTEPMPLDDKEETIVIAIKKKATLKKAAAEIRKLAEKLRPIDGLNLLAMMLTDIVNEIDGE